MVDALAPRKKSLHVVAEQGYSMYRDYHHARAAHASDAAATVTAAAATVAATAATVTGLHHQRSSQPLNDHSLTLEVSTRSRRLWAVKIIGKHGRGRSRQLCLA